MSKNHTLGDAPVEEKYRDTMNNLARALDEMFNGENAAPRARDEPDKRETGFVLLVFPFTREGGGADSDRCNFISNGADRNDIAVLFREMAARFEGQPELKGRA